MAAEAVAAWSMVLDVALVVAVGVGALAGARRGGVRTNFSFVGLVVALRASLQARPQVGALVGRVIDVPQATAEALGFVFGLVVAQVIANVVGDRLAWWLRAPRTLSPTWWLVDRLTGVVPGAASTAVIAWLVVAPMQVLDRPSGFAALTAQSKVPPVLDERLRRIVPGFADLVTKTVEARKPTTTFVIEPGPEVAVPRTDAGAADPDAEAHLVALLNDARRVAGVPPLLRDPILDGVARAHSTEMLRLGYFEHASPVAGAPEVRVVAAGYFGQRVAENIAYAPTVDEAHLGLMASLHHRANVVDPTMTRVGVGIVRTPDGVMVTQEFGSPPPG